MFHIYALTEVVIMDTVYMYQGAVLEAMLTSH